MSIMYGEISPQKDRKVYHYSSWNLLASIFLAVAIHYQ
jgi:hypothetical protein